MWVVPNITQASIDPLYAAGDILVTPAAGGADAGFEVSRVSANGRSSHVMSVQTTQSAALQSASRAVSGFQRVFVQSDTPGEFRVVGEGHVRG